MTQPETILHQTKNFGKGLSKDTQRSQSAKNPTIPQKLETSPAKKRTTPLQIPKNITGTYEPHPRQKTQT